MAGGLACVALWVALAAAAEPAPNVLVTDFQVPPAEAWQWARRGLPELAVEALGERGIATVDRDLLSVLKSEQELVAGREPERGGLRAGQLLGAAYLLAGSVETVTVSRVRLSGTLTRVETAEQIGAFTAEGDCKKELQALMGRWVAGLTGGLASGRTGAVAVAENPVKPEALIFFQQGVDACAAGKPALAVGFFLSAQDMDARLAAANEWEACAYEQGGLPAYAAAARARVALPAPGASSNAVDRGASAAARGRERVVNVLTPVWLGKADAPPAAPGRPSLTALRVALEEAVLAVPGARLYRPESLAAAVAEKDRQLSPDFDARGTARYARWLAADVALYCTLSPLPPKKIRLEVGQLDMLSARRLKPVSREAEEQEVPGLLAALVRECLSGGPALAKAPQAAERDAASKPLGSSGEDLLQLPDYRALAKALDARMFGSETVLERQALVDFYAYRGLAEVAAQEWTALLREVERSQPAADALLAAVYWWSNGFYYEPALSPDKGRRFNASLLDNEPVSSAIGQANLGLLEAVRARLQSEYPASAGTYAIAHQEALEAYFGGRWADCQAKARSAWAALEKDAAKGGAGSVSMGDYLDTPEATRALIHINCLYLQGVSASRLKAYEQAAQCFDGLLLLLVKNPKLGAVNLVVPTLSFNGQSAVVEFGQHGATSSLLHSLERERAALATAQENARQMERALSKGGLPATLIKQVAERPASRASDQLERLKAITQIWDSLPPIAGEECLFCDLATVSVEGIGQLPASDRLAVAQSLSRAYLRVTGLSPEQWVAGPARAKRLSRLQKIVQFYRSVGLGAESLYWADRFLQGSAEPGLDRELVDQIVDSLADSVALPFFRDSRPVELAAAGSRWMSQVIKVKASAKISRKRLNALADNVAALTAEKPWDATPGEQLARGEAAFGPLDDRREIVFIQAFFEKHQSLPGLSESQARFWRRLSRRAAAYGAYDVWLRACVHARACDPNFCLSDAEEQYVARVALSSKTQDVLRAALQLREKLGPSPDPLPFMSWYNAGYLCFGEGQYGQALAAFQVFRETYNEAEINQRSARLRASDSDASLSWSLDYLEGVCLAAAGDCAEAARRFRRLAQRFGARPVYLRTELTASGGGFRSARPLGLLAADELQKMHGSADADKSGQK